MAKKDSGPSQFHVFYFLKPIPGREDLLGDQVAVMRRTITARSYDDAVRKWEQAINSESLMVEPEWLVSEVSP